MSARNDRIVEIFMQNQKENIEDILKRLREVEERLSKLEEKIDG